MCVSEQTGAPNGSKVRLRVLIRDTGIGISEEQQRQLFQAFNQADSSISPPLWRHRARPRHHPEAGAADGVVRSGFESELGKGSVFSFQPGAGGLSPAPDRAAPAGSHPGQAGLAAGAGSLHSTPPCSALLAEWQLDVQSLTMADGWPEMGSQDIGDHRRQHPAYPQQVIAPSRWPQRATEHHSAAQQPRAGALMTPCWPMAPPTAFPSPSTIAKLLHALLSPKRPWRTPLPRADARRVQAVKVLAVDDNAANLAHRRHAQGDGDRGGGARTARKRSTWPRTSRSTSSSWISRCPSWMASAPPRRSGITPQHRDPIVAVTAHAIPGERERLIRQGMDDYLSKPIDEGMLAQLITDFAHRRHQNQGDQQIDWTLAVRAGGEQRGSSPKRCWTMLLASFGRGGSPYWTAALTGGVEDDRGAGPAPSPQRRLRLLWGARPAAAPALPARAAAGRRAPSASSEPGCWSCRKMPWSRCGGEAPRYPLPGRK